jgi:hypothetical protein
MDVRPYTKKHNTFEMSSMKVNFPTNTMVFAALSLVLTGIFGYGTWLTTDFTSNLRKSATILTAILLGVTGHLFQSAFGHFSVVYFLTLYNFLQNVVYSQFSADSNARVLTVELGTTGAFDTDDLQTRANLTKHASVFMFWVTIVYVAVYGAFAYVPAVQQYIPTALGAERRLY